MFKSLVASLSLFSIVLAQNSSNSSDSPAFEVEAIEAHFQNAGLVPGLLTNFTPIAEMSLNFDGVGQIQPGQALQQDQVQTQPNVTIQAANSSVPLSSGNSFTLMMVDADVVGTDETKGQTRHWLVNNVTVSGSTGQNQTIDNSSALAVTEYAGPAPPEGSGPHRYVVLLYGQPSNFTPPSNLSTANVGVSTFSLSDYVSSTGLEGPYAATYFTIEVGTASASLSATSAVESSTLSPVSSATDSSSSSTSTSGAMGKFEGFNSVVGAAMGMVAAFALV